MFNVCCVLVQHLNYINIFWLIQTTRWCTHSVVFLYEGLAWRDAGPTVHPNVPVAPLLHVALQHVQHLHTKMSLFINTQTLTSTACKSYKFTTKIIIQLNFVMANFIKMNNSLRLSESLILNRVLILGKIQLFKSKYLCRSFYVSKHILQSQSGVFLIK